jgi:hypothetical protein
MFSQPLLPLLFHPDSKLFNKPVQEFRFYIVSNIFVLISSSFPHVLRQHYWRVSRLIEFSNPIVQVNALPVVFLQFLE